MQPRTHSTELQTQTMNEPVCILHLKLRIDLATPLHTLHASQDRQHRLSGNAGKLLINKTILSPAGLPVGRYRRHRRMW